MSWSAVVSSQIEKLMKEDEDIVVFSNNGEYSLKLFFRDGEDIIFRPSSTYHSFTDFKFSKDEEFSILGKVVMYCVNL